MVKVGNPFYSYPKPIYPNSYFKPLKSIKREDALLFKDSITGRNRRVWSALEIRKGELLEKLEARGGKK